MLFSRRMLAPFKNSVFKDIDSVAPKLVFGQAESLSIFVGFPDLFCLGIKGLAGLQRSFRNV